MRRKILQALIGFLIGYLLIGPLIRKVNADTSITCKYNSSMEEYSTGNIFKSKQIHKIFKVNGLKYVVHIDSTKNFQKDNDYITIQNKKHKVTYALECK